MSRCQRNKKTKHKNTEHTHSHTLIDGQMPTQRKKKGLIIRYHFSPSLCYSSNKLAYFNPDWEESHRGSRRMLKSIKRGRGGGAGPSEQGETGDRPGQTTSGRAESSQAAPLGQRRHKSSRQQASHHRRGRERDEDRPHGRAHNVGLIPRQTGASPSANNAFGLFRKQTEEGGCG